eukprot:TRINITY_DN1612_c0_g1_i15.p1 TRINITY_DN1612_c0_g1~~TRINITY_DN1612_c0_g1_i15.p1  ORF type:complete len:237 (-),score=44.99 TRINITY_DN1612_c0_g1_i15:472-1182(-)
MVSDYGLEEVWLPLDPDYNGPKCNIFVSPDWLTAEKLMLLIQGTGAVRPGQWARALCINDNLREGSILPYLHECREVGYSVIVFNPNQNDGPINPSDANVYFKSFLSTKKGNFNVIQKEVIPGNGSMSEHCLYVWDHLVAKSSAKVISCVAHSAGGSCAKNLIAKREEAYNRVCGIAFTDSVHLMTYNDSSAVQHYIQKRCRNWVRSTKPLDTKVVKPKFDCLNVSAGMYLVIFMN